MELRDDSWKVPCPACTTELYIRGKATRQAIITDRNVNTVFRDLDLQKIKCAQLEIEVAHQALMIDHAVDHIVAGGAQLNDVVLMLEQATE